MTQLSLFQVDRDWFLASKAYSYYTITNQAIHQYSHETTKYLPQLIIGVGRYFSVEGL